MTSSLLVEGGVQFGMPVAQNMTLWHRSRANNRMSITIQSIKHSYIIGKTLGIDEANLKAAAGVFMGYSTDLRNAKAHGKVHVYWVLDQQRTLTNIEVLFFCLLYTSPSPRDATLSRMPSSA